MTIVSPAVAQSNVLIPTPTMHLALLVLSVIYIILTPIIATSLRVKNGGKMHPNYILKFLEMGARSGKFATLGAYYIGEWTRQFYKQYRFPYLATAKNQICLNLPDSVLNATE